MGGEWEEAVGGVGKERGGERRKEERVRRKEGGRERVEREERGYGKRKGGGWWGWKTANKLCYAGV